jgi:hypothetical protein
VDIQTINLCQRAFEDYLNDLVQKGRKQQHNGLEMVEPPIIGGLYSTDDLEKIKHKITRALLARAWWGNQEGVALPLNDIEMAKLQGYKDDSDNSPMVNLVGYFAPSLRDANWDYNIHPSFSTFCRGVLAAPHEYCRYGVEVYQEFPPQRLVGLDPRNLRWSRVNAFLCK